jgi:hypothetical protein
MPIIGRHEGDEERRNPHAEQRRNQRCLAADAVTVVPEDCSTDRPAEEADKIGAERGEGRGQRALLRKEQFADDQSGRGAVDEEVVPFDRGADRRRNDGFAQLGAMLGWRQRRL